MVLWVMFSIYALLFSLHCVCMLDMHTSLCYYALLDASSDDHLLCYVIIVVISLWLFWCMVKLLIYFTSYLLDHDLLVTLYLSFYYLLYLECLICFMQVFQVTGIYIPSPSHHAYMLDMHISLCYCVFLIACSNDHLLCYMIIVVISIWLSCVWSSYSYVSHHIYLITFYLLHYTCSFITCFTLRV